MSVMESLSRHSALSFQVFPPRTEAGRRELLESGGVLDRLYRENPDFLCCTYGAGGTDAGKNLEVLEAVVSAGKTQAMTQLICAGNTAQGIREQLRNYLRQGIDCVTALRGGETRMSDGLSDEAELVKLIRREFSDSFTVAVDGAPGGGTSGMLPGRGNYPAEGHPGQRSGFPHYPALLGYGHFPRLAGRNPGGGHYPAGDGGGGSRG